MSRPPLAVPDPEPSKRVSCYPGRPTGDRHRAHLLSLVAANPGLHIMRAACLLGLNWNTCLHHARRLEREGVVVLRKVSGKLCLFDRREGSVQARLAPLLLREVRNADLARLVVERSGLNQKAMADELGVAASVVHRRLVRLEDAGLVQRVPQANGRAVYATAALERAWRGYALPAQLDDGLPAALAEESLAPSAATATPSAAAPIPAGLHPTGPLHATAPGRAWKPSDGDQVTADTY